MYITTAKRICDLCGKKIQKNGYRLSSMVLTKTGNIFRDVYRYCARVRVDLCPSCAKQWEIPMIIDSANRFDINKVKCDNGDSPTKEGDA